MAESLWIEVLDDRWQCEVVADRKYGGTLQIIDQTLHEVLVQHPVAFSPMSLHADGTGLAGLIYDWKTMAETLIERRMRWAPLV